MYNIYAGAILDATGSFVAPFLVAGSLIATGGFLCLPVRRIARWEKERNEKRQAPTNVWHLSLGRVTLLADNWGYTEEMADQLTTYQVRPHLIQDELDPDEAKGPCGPASPWRSPSLYDEFCSDNSWKSWLYTAADVLWQVVMVARHFVSWWSFKSEVRHSRNVNVGYLILRTLHSRYMWGTV